jgi:hypothetical protein
VSPDAPVRSRDGTYKILAYQRPFIIELAQKLGMTSAGDHGG